MKVLRIEMI